MIKQSKILNDSFGQIRERALSSVEFVADYVQLRFDGPTLTSYNWPSVTVAGKTFLWGEDGFRDALCARIGIIVENTSVIEDQDLAIYFADGAIIKISLREEDYRSIEAVYFVEEGGSFWVL